jgi:hypothetical protein
MFKTRNISPFTFVLTTLMVLGGPLCCDVRGSEVVINEIHSDPDVKTELVEFVELYNAGGQDVDLSGWYFSEGIFYTFKGGTTLPAGGYVIVCQSPADVHAKWSSGRFQLPENAVLGPYGGKLSNEGEQIVLCNTDGKVMDKVDYQLGFPWPTVGDPISEDLPGSGCSMQLVNPLFDNDLGGSWRSAAPTPLAKNSRVFADNIPPHIRQVKHSPQQPKSGDIVTVTAKVTDPDGVDGVHLLYQLVDPSDYFGIEQQRFYENWNALEMHDDGLNGDLNAGDDVYTVQLPESLQIHRRLVRYRIHVADNLGYSLVVPYADDPQPNFAYFVYDGAPAWKGAVRPDGSVVEYSPEIMNSLPIYHLISRAEDVQECQFVPISDARCNPEASLYKWRGTLVYDGVVYDHIRYRARGGWATYEFGKNRWKFDFNRGHYFQARDDYGRKYKEKWDKLNFSACFQFTNTNNRGEQGMYEAVTARLFALASVPVSNMSWLHFRVIDDAQEANPNNQYEGDFWGLYLAIEQPDGRFLDRNNLPDGNMYKMYFPCNGDQGDMSNQGPTQVTDHSDVIAFCQAYHAYPSDRQWWEQNTNLDLYYSYRAICDAVHHYDLTDRWNCFYYHNPETNRWSMLPWDFDHTWDTDIYTDDDEYWKQVLDRRLFQGHSVGHPAVYHQFPDCIIAFQNRARGLNDLLINGEQCVQLINECAAVISDPAGWLSFVDADRALWDQNPHNTNPGTFYQSSPTGDFAGMVQRMRDFVSPGGWGYNRIASIASDNDIPYTPTVTSTGPANYPINTLTFETSPFNDPQGSHTFAAMKWRIGEINAGSQYSMPDNKYTIPSSERKPGKYEIEAVWESEEITDHQVTCVTIPASVVSPGRTYRVRCRMQDNTGRWSHWSQPLQFVAGEAVSQGVTAGLRITELMYNPTGTQDGTNNDNYEFIELKNIGDDTLDLTHVSFADGIVFDFNNSTITHIEPGQFVLVVSNITAFVSRYGQALSSIIAGEYSGRFSNDGERVALVDYWDGTIADFEYGDKGSWPALADGLGHSLVPLDSALVGQSDGSLSDASSWRASTNVGGSPGADDP